MSNQYLQSLFIKFCKINKFEVNNNQVEIIGLLDNFLNSKIFFLNYFFNYKHKMCFYLSGNVGVGKTMLLNFVYNKIKIRKLRLHYNEFMIKFHNFRHKRDNDNSIKAFVTNLKKNYELIYLDEFQVTNIVDAMILGKLFEVIFSEKIKIILTTNIKLQDLYKDGLQREQFLPFISIIKKNSIQKELILEEDYRKIRSTKLKRSLSPINKKNSFQINQIFRELTKNKKKSKIAINIKGRNFTISSFYEGIARFDFKQLCDVNIGAEDYLEISNKCKFIIIENIPSFNNENSNQQNRFITLVDILYEKKIPLLISISSNLNSLASADNLKGPFQRTVSRLYELTSPDINI